ncbi:carboxypeptidase regulatory-like domain-containing protein [Pandoraea terrae]|uniref:Carboxypeptidase regulatory-like domain-containing protein n=1 Tax=Pandoraea terrae TaxID=1537710 RepID=A0A5E4UQA6_9BURK|nr:carboxypeptidase regulatory-like domain-containing protein [Pandoraea terrae]VVE02158.1 carboxypeptidase regulatory-like domain-containing protein [Pandoraea terrae]
MKQSMKRWSVAAAATLALAGGAALAQAQSEGLPPEVQQGSVSYLSGGVAGDESAAIKQAMGRYPLSIELYAKGDGANEFLADVPVRISTAHDKMVLDVTAKGPFLLVKVPPGAYTVRATYEGKEMIRKVNVSAKGHARAVFLWNQM